MDVLSVGMYRACSTWQYEVIAHLLERHRDGQRLGYVTGEQYAAHVVRSRSRPDWRVLKSHEGHRGFAKALAQGRALAVYAYRDIRDVVFSLMHKRGVIFERLVRQGMIHQILVNDRFWSTQQRVLPQRYESLIADPIAGVRELASYLGIAITDAEAADVAAEYLFQTNRRRTIELVDRLRDQGIDLDDPSNLQYYDQRTLLHWNHLREGRPGKWRTHATPEQRVVLARLCDAWLVAHGYEADTLNGVEVPSGLLTSLHREVELARSWLACALRVRLAPLPEDRPDGQTSARDRVRRGLRRTGPLANPRPDRQRPALLLSLDVSRTVPAHHMHGEHVRQDGVGWRQ